MKKTYSTKFLSPMLPSQLVNKRKRLGFLNLYIGDLEHDIQHENAIYALFKPNFSVQYEKFVQDIKKHPRFLELYGIKTFCGKRIANVTRHIMMVFSIPGIYAEDYKKFIEGYYSQFTNDYTRRFRAGTLMYKVIKRDPNLKKHWEKLLDCKLDNAELMAKPNLELEIFRYNNDNFKIVKEIWNKE